MKTDSKKMMREGPSPGLLLLFTLVLASGMGPNLLWANPTGQTVVHGQATFSQQGNTLIIQAANNTIINYQSFDILANETVQFVQPSSSSRVLNRVLSDVPTSILGTLLANGQVYIINPAGIYFGNGSHINVGNLIAAGGNLSDQDFMSRNNHFTGVNGNVENDGTITAGSVTLAGQEVVNHGEINVSGGVVAMLAGDDILVGQRNGHVFVNLGSANSANATGVENTGTINAGGGQSLLAAGDLYSLAVANSGTINARQITLEGTGSGLVQVSGTLNASAPAPGGVGGNVEVVGQDVALTGATIDASGNAGGGTVLIGGSLHGSNPNVINSQGTFVSSDSQIHADALERGNGGEVVVWSDGATRDYGTITARGGAQGGNGGLVETSGKIYLDVTEAPDVSAAHGTGGSWLLDPSDITIISESPGTLDTLTPVFTANADSSTISSAVIDAALNNNENVIISTANPKGTQEGNIYCEAPILKTSSGSASLTMLADYNINIYEPITSTGGSLNVTLTAANGINLYAPIETHGGNFQSSGYTFYSSSPGEENPLSGSISTSGGSLTLNFTGSVEIYGTLNSGLGNISITAGSLYANDGALSGSGTLTIQPASDGEPINVGQGDFGGDGLIVNFDWIQPGFSGITIGRSSGYNTINVYELSTSAPLTIMAPQIYTGDGVIPGTIYVNGPITATGNASVNLVGSGDTTYLYAGITTAGQDITINDNVMVGPGVVLSTGPTSGNIHIGGTVDGIINNTPGDLTLNAGGNIMIDGSVGSLNPLNNLDLEAKTILLGGASYSADTINFFGPTGGAVDNSKLATVVGSSPDGLAINATTAFTMGQNEKLVVTDGNLTIDSPTAALGDLGASGNITVNAPNIILLDRFPTPDALGDEGLDFVAQAITFNGTASYAGTGNGTVAFATQSGAAAVNSLPGMTQYKLTFQPFIGTTSSGAVLDPIANQPGPQMATALGLVAPVPQTETAEVTLEDLIGLAYLDDLKNLGIYARPATREELFQSLCGQGLYVQQVVHERPNPEEYQVVDRRMSQVAVKDALSIYHAIIPAGLPPAAADQLKTKLKQTVNETYASYIEKTKHAEDDPSGYWAYLEGASKSGDATAQGVLANLQNFRKLFGQLDELGLTGIEVENARHYLLHLVEIPSVLPVDLEKVIEPLKSLNPATRQTLAFTGS